MFNLVHVSNAIICFTDDEIDEFRFILHKYGNYLDGPTNATLEGLIYKVDNELEDLIYRD